MSTSARLLLLAMVSSASACSVRPSSCGDEPDELCRRERIVVAGETRTYIVSRKHGLDCASKQPLILFFHGQDSNGSEARTDYAPFEDAIGGRALVVYPDGLSRPEIDGKAGWNRDPDGNDWKLVDALVPRLAADYCVDEARVFAVGHSRGGRFVEMLACFHADRFRGFAESSAGAGNVSSCAQRAPMWIAHAQNDEQIPFRDGLATRDAWAQRDGCAAPDGDFAMNACTPLTACTQPVVWCPYDGTEWRGHYPPPFFGEAVWAFFATL